MALLMFVPAALAAALAAPAAEAGPTPLYFSSPSTTPVYLNMTAVAGVQANDSILSPDAADKERTAGFMNGGRGACVLDYDDDGDDDIYVVGPGKHQLFRNDGDWSFADVTDSAGVGDTGYGMACASGDLNNDGHQDIIATHYGSHFSIFRNNGNGTFTNMTSGSGIDSTGPQTGIAIADFDNDGLLDFMVTEYGKSPDRLYRNLGAFTFSDKTSSSGIHDFDFGFQPLAVDYDSDGDQDIYVINNFGADTLWENTAPWTFSDVTQTTGANDPRGGMGGAWGDFNGDGSMDVYVGNYEANGLWSSDGSTYQDVGNSSGVDDGWTTWGVVWTDYDNDGWPDLYIANGNVDVARSWLQPNKLFRNLGNGSFADVGAGSGGETGEVSRGLATGDFDGDGREDVYVVNMNCPAMLLKNNVTNTNTWLNVKLQGTVSNRDGVGATVSVVTGTHAQMNLVAAGSSYLSSNSKVLHFGLGNASVVDRLVVKWPSGLEETMRLVDVNQTLSITETDPTDPTASAPDVVADQGVPFELNGTNSTDNVRIVSWQWQLTGNGTQYNASGARATMTIYSPGSYLGVLTVRDPFNRTGLKLFNVTIRPLAAVWVELGPDITIPERTTFVFSASGASSATPDFEGDCTFAWTVYETGPPVNLTGPHPSFRFDRPGVWRVQVSVRDPQNITATDSFNITVADATTPSIVATVPASVDEDMDVLLDASATTDNDPTFPATALFQWSYPAYARTMVWSGAVVTATFDDPGTFQLTLTVVDGSGNFATKTYTIVVRDRTPPVAEAGPDSVDVLPGQEVILDGSGSTDNDARFPDAGTFRWAVHTLEGTTNYSGVRQVFSFDYPETVAVDLFVTDPSGNPAAAPDRILIHVLDIVPPVPEAGGARTVSVGETVIFDGSATTDNDPTILETGEFAWEFQDGTTRYRLEGLSAPYVFLRAGTYTVRLTVADAGGNKAAILFKVTVVDESSPQLVVDPIPSAIDSGTSLALNASGTTDNVGVTSIGWRISGPYGFEQFVTSAQGSLVLSIAGVYNVTVTAHDAAGNIATASFLVTVRARQAEPNQTGGGDGGGEGGNGNNTGPTETGGPAAPPTTSPTPLLGVLPLVGALAAVILAAALVRLRRVRR